MKRTALLAVLLINPVAVWAADQPAHGASGHGKPSRPFCLVEVMDSEELPGAPIFQNRVRARLQITRPGQPPLEVVVEGFIPWQEPPPRRGQRLHLACDPTAMDVSVF